MSEVPGNGSLDVRMHGQEEVCPSRFTFARVDEKVEAGGREEKTRELVRLVEFQPSALIYICNHALNFE